MSWLNHLKPKERRGSRPRCVALMDGGPSETARRLTDLIALPKVTVSREDPRHPYGKPVYRGGAIDRAPVREIRLDEKNALLPPPIRERLRGWWLAFPHSKAETPNWDIAAACEIRGERGVVLVEAKAHVDELSKSGKPKSNPLNHRRIAEAIGEANAAFGKATGARWNLSRDRHYQLSNRFAWSWKIAALGVPVVLVYLGFLNADDMIGGSRRVLRSAGEWESVVKEHAQSAVPETCWNRWMSFGETPFIPVMRSIEQAIDA